VWGGSGVGRALMTRRTGGAPTPRERLIPNATGVTAFSTGPQRGAVKAQKSVKSLEYSRNYAARALAAFLKSAGDGVPFCALLG
jgi:hypothetical protein